MIVNPGIYIHGKGLVGLPLSERDTVAVSDAIHPAPFGRGTDTVVDPTVKHTLELNLDQFELRNPKLQSAVKDIKIKVAQELGVPSNHRFKAVLHNLEVAVRPPVVDFKYISISTLPPSSRPAEFSRSRGGDK